LRYEFLAMSYEQLFRNRIKEGLPTNRGQRRQLLQILSYAFGAGFILPRNEFAMSAQNPAQPARPAPPAKAAAKQESGGTEMEKVAGRRYDRRPYKIASERS